jgi:hypothetical protein
LDFQVGGEFVLHLRVTQLAGIYRQHLFFDFGVGYKEHWIIVKVADTKDEELLKPVSEFVERKVLPFPGIQFVNLL